VSRPFRLTFSVTDLLKLKIYVITIADTCSYGALAVAAVGQADTKGYVLCRRTYFLKRKSIQANTISTCRFVYLQCTKMRTMTFSHSNPVLLHPSCCKQIIGLPAVLSSSFTIWFWNGKELKCVRVNKLVAGEIAAIRIIGGNGCPGLPGNPECRGENPWYR
jgi:hypothetical protein